MGIFDSPVERIIKEALVEHKCTQLNLCWNKLTHEGVAKLAKVLKNNEVETCPVLFLMQHFRS